MLSRKLVRFFYFDPFLSCDFIIFSKIVNTTTIFGQLQTMLVEVRKLKKEEAFSVAHCLFTIIIFTIFNFVSVEIIVTAVTLHY